MARLPAYILHFVLVMAGMFCIRSTDDAPRVVVGVLLVDIGGMIVGRAEMRHSLLRGDDA